ncbi:hypothetical protein P8452_10773 [Trifolium repens]|nr:hypothetical protein QL285_054510 [Trifolium repens]WJX21325.1 hypothetical protein P8452_10773 [Trifolium repens]
MAYVKFAPFAVLLIAAISMFPMKKVESYRCPTVTCYMDRSEQCSFGCICYPSFFGTIGSCQPSYAVTKMVDEHPSLCRSHADCTTKGSGSFCSHYPDSDVEYGRCFFSKLEAEDFIKMTSNSKFTKDFLKMSTT